MPSLREEITKTLVRFSRRGEAGNGIFQNGTTKAPRDNRESRQYGAYRIIRQLGAGGMGHVYLALDTRLGRHVALKFLPHDLTDDAEFLQRFQQEARTTSSLNHPNIVTIYDFTEIDGESILVTEFIEGITLRTLLDRGTLPLEMAVQIAMETAAALGVAHAAGIVHRDLKPSNIMVRPDGYVKVIDFGLAKFAGWSRRSGKDLTVRGTVIGTVDYMSPEQASGEDVDQRSDVWSLGVILYELVTGNRPFQGQTESHVIVNILDRPPQPIPQSDSLPAGFAIVIERALVKDRAKRYQSAREMLSDLQQVQRQAGFSADSRPIVIVRPPSRKPWFVAGALLAILIGGWSLWWWGFSGRDRILGPDWFEFRRSRPVTFSGNVAQTSIAPNGKRLAYTTGFSGRQALHLVDLERGSDRALTDSVANYIGLTFSPDSRTLFYVIGDDSEMGRLFARRVDNLSEPGKMVLERVDGPVVFSPKGNQFAFLRVARESDRSTNEIWVASETNTANPKRIVSLAGTQITPQLAWMSRHNLIAAVEYPEQLNAPTRATVALFNANGGAVSTFVPNDIRSLFLPVALDGGALLVFSGTPQGAQQRHLVQFHVATGAFHETPTDVVGFDSLSATADSQTLASVRVDQRSSVFTVDAGWNASSGGAKASRRVSRDSEYIRQVTWTDDSALIFPSSRTGSVNLARLQNGGSVESLSLPTDCVEAYPEVLPDRRLVVYSSNCAHGGDDFNLWTLDLKTGKKRQLTSGTSYDYQPDPSPDGNWIVYTSWSSNLASIWKVPVAGGIPLRLSALQGRMPYVSPDGQKIVCQIREPHQRWTVAILNMADGTVVNRFPELPANSGIPVRWSPDGKALDYVKPGPGSLGIWRQPVSGGPPMQLSPPTEDPITYFEWNRNGSRLAYIVEHQQRDVVLFYRGSQDH
jgi:eukaryotic-like serine/threonine-protein kinase